MKQENTIKQLKKYLKTELEEIYSHSEIDALSRIVFEHITNIDSVKLLRKLDYIIEEPLAEEFFNIVEQLKENKPIQYIIGETEFYNIKVRLSPDVLIPRQETEELVDWILKDHPTFSGSIIDLGTGSGCIGLSLAKNLPNASIDLMDISDKALLMAIKNAQYNKVKANFYLFDVLDFEGIDFPSKYDIIVSNPPYVRQCEKLVMHANVLEYEPELALFVEDNNPLQYYKAVAKFGQQQLNKNGEIYVEINEAFGKETQDIFNKMGYTKTILKQDLNGKDRMLYAKY